MDQASMPSGPANPLSALSMLSKSKMLKSYADADLPITVKGDSTGLNIQVPDQASAHVGAGGTGIQGP
jgi:hypothetical protein